jgi:hypothetical protein
VIKLQAAKELKNLALLTEYLLFECLSLLLPLSQVFFKHCNLVLVAIRTIAFVEIVKDV